MKRFFRNIHGSSFWRRVAAICLMLVMVATLLPADIKIARSEDSGKTTLFDGTTVTTVGSELYANEIDLRANPNAEIPANALISMILNYKISDGNQIEAGKEYYYELPKEMKSEFGLNETLELIDSRNNESIGTVKIDQENNRLVYVFNDKLKDQHDVFFNVSFSGSLDSSYQTGGKQVTISFPTESEPITATITTTDSTVKPENPTAVQIYKSGTVKNVDGKNYVEWVISMQTNGSTPVSGTLKDTLPDGWTYVPGSARIDTTGNYLSGSITDKSDGQNVEIEVSDCKSYYQSVIRFYTTYPDTIFGDETITAGTTVSQNNTILFTPEDSNIPGSDATGTVTIQPNMLEKTGVMDADAESVTWTVVLNKEQLNLAGATLTDTVQSGLQVPETAGDITIQPALGANATLSVDSNTNAFQIVFNNQEDKNTYTITYKTKITDAGYSLDTLKNQASLTEDNKYNVTKEGTVPGVSLLKKEAVSNSYDSVTQTMKWKITVNESEINMGDITLTEHYGSDMEYASIEGLEAGETISEDGTSIELKNVTGKRELYITTKVKDTVAIGGHNFTNTVTLGPYNITKNATMWVEIKDADLISKNGWITDKDGTIQWVVIVNSTTHTIEDMKFSDILPSGTEYVPGSLCVRYGDWNPKYYPAANEIALGTQGSGANAQQTIAYIFDKNTDVNQFLDGKAFQIVYKTKVTDPEVTTKRQDYTNKATLSVTYEDNLKAEETEGKTVTGAVGGVIDKTHNYGSGNNYVDWTVTINKGRYDLSTVKSPKISDQLNEAYVYESGTLYTVDENGNEQAVSASDYKITCVNNMLTVILPKDADDKYLGTTSYVFRFRVLFNHASGYYSGKQITNTIDFSGEGQEYESVSNVLERINFKQAAASATINYAIYVRKVDSQDHTKGLEGAVFQLYLDGVCVQEATTNANGYAIFTGIDPKKNYTYVLKEIQAPDGYVLPADSVEVTTAPADFDATTRNKEVIIENTPIAIPTGSAYIHKIDAESSLPVRDTTFCLYENLTDAVAGTNVVATKTSGMDGQITFGGLTIGKTYYIKETVSAPGYLPMTYIIKADITTDTATTYTYVDESGAAVPGMTATEETISGNSYLQVTNRKAVGTLEIHKIKAGGSLTVSGDHLAGAKIGLYTDESCNYPVEAAKTTDATGVVTFSDLILGKTYYYKELEAPDGYVLDTTVYSVVIGQTGEQVNRVESVALENQKQSGSIEITKTDDSLPGKPLVNVTFKLQNLDTDGTYKDYIPDGEATVYTVVTDAKGKATFENLPYGDYQLVETSTDEKYYTAAPVKVTVDSQTKQTVSIVNETKRFDLEITKVDSADAAKLLAGAEFKLYTANGVYVATGTTGTDGQVSFKNLAYGDYVLKETKRPQGYSYMTDANGTELSEWTISKADIDTAIGDADTNNDGYPDQTVRIAQTITNKKQNGSIRIQKNYSYTENGIPRSVGLGGIEFTLYDEQRIAVKTAISSSEAATLGQVLFTELPYGTYYLKETKAEVWENGKIVSYIMDQNAYKFVVDSDTVVTKAVNRTEDLVITNKKFVNPIISVKVKKVVDSQPLEKAEFGLYRTNGTTPSLISTAYSDADGIVYFRLIDLGTSADTPTTTYSIKERSAPAGYTISSQEISFTYEELVGEDTYKDDKDHPKADSVIPYAKQDVTNATFVDQQILGSIEITKTDVVSIGKVQGVEFTLTDANGTVVKDKNGNDRIATTDANGKVIFDELPFGTYVIHETGVPNGYTLSTKQETVIINSDSMHKVTYSDTRIDIALSKQSVTGEVLTGAEFRLDRKETNGSYTKLTTLSCNMAKIKLPYDQLHIGQTYRLTETKAPQGYAYMDPIEFKIEKDGSVTLLSGNGTLSSNTIIAKDTPITFTVHKLDNNTPAQYVKSAVLGLYNSKGQKLTEWTTAAAGYGLPVGILEAPAEEDGLNVYTIRELTTPEGYVTAEPVSIAVKHDGSIYRYEQGQITGGMITSIDMVDAVIVDTDLFIQKLDAGTDTGLAGAEFIITNANGAQTDVNGNDASAEWSWISDGTAHKLDGSRFSIGEKYQLVEQKAPAGYATMQSITFQVKKDGNKYEFILVSGTGATLTYDSKTLLARDQRLQLRVEKVDGLNAALGGAELMIYQYDGTAANGLGNRVLDQSILSADNGAVEIPYDQLRADQTYVLHEIQPPAGYKLADDILFMLTPDGKVVIQRLENGIVTNDADATANVYNNTVVMVDQEADLTITKVKAGDTTQAVIGATLQLSSEDDLNFTTQTWTSTTTEKVWNLSFTELRKGKHYTLTELTAPNGYSYAEPITFTVDPNTNQVLIKGKAVENRTIYMEDQTFELTVQKVEEGTGQPVNGAKLAIYDAETMTQVVPAWTTGDTKVKIDTSLLTTGNGSVGDQVAGALHEYILREVAAPTGYQVAEDIRFAIDRNGIVYTVTQKADGTKTYTKAADNLLTMQDRPMLSVCKQDVDGAIIAGATFRITTAEDAAFQPMTFVSGEIPTYLSDTVFRTGITYTLTEEKAPQGYAYAEPITFQIRENGDVYVNGRKSENRQIAMVDTAITVKVAKQDAESKAGLAGATLVIKNEAGEILYSFSSEAAAVQIPSVVFSAPKDAALQYYTLTELAAPNGYEVADSIAFALDRDGQIYIRNAEGTYEKLTTEAIVMLDQPSADTSSSHIAKGPKTGDQAPIAWIGLTGTVSMLGAVLLLKKKTRK